MYVAFGESTTGRKTLQDQKDNKKVNVNNESCVTQGCIKEAFTSHINRWIAVVNHGQQRKHWYEWRLTHADDREV